MTRTHDRIRKFDEVRSLDFEHRDDCFVEGVVVGFADLEGCVRYAIRVTRRVWNGVEVDANRPFAYPPANGIPSYDGTTRFVELISRPDEDDFEWATVEIRDGYNAGRKREDTRT